MTAGTVTKASVLRAARAKYGPKVNLRYNPNAPDAVRKVELREQVRVRMERKKSLEEERKALFAQGDPRVSLRNAARFAIDVDGDEPSWTQLREALEREERYAAISSEIRELQEEGRKGCGWSYRWDVVLVVNIAGLAMAEVRASADTLEELAAKLSVEAG